MLLPGVFAQQKGIDFTFDNELDEGLEVVGDPGRLRQILSNLLTNSLKFTTRGHVKTIVNSKKPLASANEGESLEITFTVEDTGIGIKKQVLDRLFRPFSQGDASTARLYGGTGLGLTISRNLAMLMGGSLELESTYSVGSRAIFKIPLKISKRDKSDLSTHHRNLSHSSNHIHNSGSRSLIWTEPLVQRSMSLLNQDLINQQISNSATENYSQNHFAISGM